MQVTEADNLKLAIGAILSAVFALSLGDALIKQYSADFVIWQIFVMRSAIAVPFLVYFARIRSCTVSIRPSSIPWTLLRSLILVFMWMFYFAALPHVDLAVAAAAYYTLPLFITLFAALWLGEEIRTRGWIAVALGFLGTLLVLQPQADDFNLYSLLPVVAAICYACGMTLTRSKCRGERATVLSLWLHGSFVAVGGLALVLLYAWSPAAETVAVNRFLLGAWTPMWIDEWSIMAILSVAAVIGSIGGAIAYQRGSASIVATFDFAYVAFAAIWGFLLFAEVPAPLVSAGIVLIVVAGVIASWQRLAQERANR